MADRMTKSQRSYVMSRIKGKNTKPELKLKPALESLGFLYQPKIYGSPDFANKKHRIAIFIDGCFWHKCPECFKKPKSNKSYWANKISGNVKRDKKTSFFLKKMGWRVIRIWEHDIMK